MKMRLSAAALLVGAAGLASAQPVIDGQLGTDAYGPIRWVQNQPTTFGNNVAGTGGTLGDPQNVTTGVELAIPLSVLGNPTGAIRLAGFVNGGGHDYLSNQVIGGLPTNTGNPGEPRNVNFTTLAGDQFINLSPSVVSSAPTIDGTRDAIYGGPKFIQNNFTGFGNASNGSPTAANGSEIDAVYAVIYDNGTPTDTSDDVLYVFIAGNLETNFNKLDLFFDVNATDGQNQLRGDNCQSDYNGVNRMGAGGNGTANAGPGLKFDAGFTADYWVGITNGSYPVENYVNSAVLRANGPIYVSGYILDYSATDGGLKSVHNPVNYPATHADIQDFSTSNPLTTDAGPRTTQQNPNVLVPGLIVAAINNNNVGGVSGTTLPVSVSDAANVTTGLAELGWDGGPVRVAGFLGGIGHDFVSNQVIGGLPTPAGQDFAPSLGETTLIDFSAIPGNQFVTIPPPGPACGTADFNCDGDIGTDADIAGFFACLSGTCPPPPCTNSADFNGDGDIGTDADIEAFFRVLSGGHC
jgi:hypothetical protein